MTKVGVLDKVMAILDTFKDGSQWQEPARVANQVGISDPTAYRLMRAMAEHGLLEADARRFRLGTRLLQLGALVAEGIDAREVARPHMKELRDATGETVELQILVGHNRVPVEMVVGNRAVRAMDLIGVPLPIHIGASSRVLLAWLDRGIAMDLASRSAAAYPEWPWDAQAYEQQLDRVRQQGWEFSGGERDPEMSAVAAPIFGPDGDLVAALVVSGTATRFARETNRSQVIERTCAAAADIASELNRGPKEHINQESIA